MNSGLRALLGKTGTFEGYGVNHEGQRFRGTMIVTPRVEGKGLTIDFVATGDDGSVYHKEHSILGLTPNEGVSLWVLSNNHPGVVEHRLLEVNPVDGADSTHRFGLGNVDDRARFAKSFQLIPGPMAI